VTTQNVSGPLQEQRHLSRREMLHYIWLASLGILTAEIAYVNLRYALPRARPGEFGGVIPCGPISDLPAPGSAPLNIPAGKLWLVHTVDGLLALHKVCTHLDCLFNWDRSQQRFVCPCHGSQFAVDGTFLSGPAPRSLDRFVVQVVDRDGQVLAETDPISGAPLPVVKPGADAEDALVSLFGDDARVQVDTARKIPGRSALAL